MRVCTVCDFLRSPSSSTSSASEKNLLEVKLVDSQGETYRSEEGRDNWIGVRLGSG